MAYFVQTNDIQLHYLDHPGEKPVLVLLHGLSANAHSFDGLVAAGLPNRVIAMDLRGRGQSDKPQSGYTMADHARDIVGMLDALSLPQVVLGGHSFGGLLTAFIAAHYPERVSRCIVIDAGFLHPDVRELIKPSLNRLGQVLPSWEAYRDAIQVLPFWAGYWDAHVEAYYRADVRSNDDGTVQAWSSPEAIAAAVEHALAEDWHAHLGQVRQHTLMLNAVGSFGPPGTAAILPYEKALETVAAYPHCEYIQIAGNHMTMLYGDHAAQMVAAIGSFLQTEAH